MKVITLYPRGCAISYPPGHAERALELMQTRAASRVAFGKRLSEQGTVQRDIAESRIEIEQVGAEKLFPD